MIKTVFMTSHMAELKGSAMSLSTLVLGLDKCRYRPIVCFAKPGPLIEKLGDHDIRTVRIAYNGFAKLFTFIRLYLFLRSAKVDLVYVNCAVGFSRVAAKAARCLGIPVVWHVREPPLGSRVQKNLKWMKKLAQLVVVVSEELRQYLAPHVGEIINVPNGVDLQRFQPGVITESVRTAYGIPPSAFIVGCIGSLEERKNTRRFVQAAIDIAEKYDHVYCLVVGAGEHKYVEALKDSVHERELEKRIVFTGPRWDMPEIMASLDVLMMPSEWEGFPRVVIESMAVGTPVIASNVGDVPAIIRHGEDGIIMQSWRRDDLIAVMSWAVEHQVELSRYAESAVANVRCRFSQGRHVEKMQALFDKLM